MMLLGLARGVLAEQEKLNSVARLLSIMSTLVKSILSSPVYLVGSRSGQLLFLLVIAILALLAFAIVSEVFHFLSIGLYPLQPAL